MKFFNTAGPCNPPDHYMLPATERLAPLTEGLAQLDQYLGGLGLETGWLVIFDQRGGLSAISERITNETAITLSGKTVNVIRV